MTVVYHNRSLEALLIVVVGDAIGQTMRSEAYRGEKIAV